MPIHRSYDLDTTNVLGYFLISTIYIYVVYKKEQKKKVKNLKLNLFWSTPNENISQDYIITLRSC